MRTTFRHLNKAPLILSEAYHYFIILLSKYPSSAKMWQQVDKAEDDDPHAVNEVPVHFGGLHREMVFGGEIAT